MTSIKDPISATHAPPQLPNAHYDQSKREIQKTGIIVHIIK